MSGVFIPIVVAVRALLPLPDGFDADDRPPSRRCPSPSICTSGAPPALQRAEEADGRFDEAGIRLRVLYGRRKGEPRSSATTVACRRRSTRSSPASSPRSTPTGEATCGGTSTSRTSSPTRCGPRTCAALASTSWSSGDAMSTACPLPLAPSAGPFRPRRSRPQAVGGRLAVTHRSRGGRAYAAAHPSVGIVEERPRRAAPKTLPPEVEA